MKTLVTQRRIMEGGREWEREIEREREKVDIAMTSLWDAWGDAFSSESQVID